MAIPRDPVILLSYINTQLRDFYPSLEEYCASEGVDGKEITDKLESIGYRYEGGQNRFVPAQCF